ncbi:MAG: hypothetical protein LBP19_02425 [Treponema sp.]|jgi:hypothetical protein|nr:hypothetical protein [Treponema sp.]
MIINASITGISYTPFLCPDLPLYQFENVQAALNHDASFLLQTGRHTVAVSAWVSPKRTRSYPYARVYNTLIASGKKITIIPFVKDEGKDGDRDFIQWDTVSLMSLLGVNVIIAAYADAEKNQRYAHKITNQRFNAEYISGKIQDLLSYQSDALHWNIEQINNIAVAAELSKHYYESISIKTGVTLHSVQGIEKRIATIKNDTFQFLSRKNAQSAQQREINTIQPKECVQADMKARINITNYLGGTYYFTCDEARIEKDTVYIIEGKHTKQGELPSLDDIKDGLIKMILYSNLKHVSINNTLYAAKPVLKLTAGGAASGISADKKKIIEALLKEARANNFTLEVPQGYAHA